MTNYYHMSIPYCGTNNKLTNVRLEINKHVLTAVHDKTFRTYEINTRFLSIPSRFHPFF